MDNYTTLANLLQAQKDLSGTIGTLRGRQNAILERSKQTNIYSQAERLSQYKTYLHIMSVEIPAIERHWRLIDSDIRRQFPTYSRHQG